MHPDKALGPDGMNPFFFPEIQGHDVSAALLSTLHGHPIPPTLNITYFTFMPKKAKPESISEFRPISLCNVIYKLITLVIVNHLKPLLPRIILYTQGAFVQGRLISNNIPIAFELLHAIHGDSSANGIMAVKLDMSKAFGRVK